MITNPTLNNVSKQYRMRYPEIAGKKVLVTGGTRGIGYKIAEGFCANGTEVHVTGSKQHGECPRGAIYHGCNFTDQSELDSFCTSLGELGIQILVNNAGVNSPAPFADITSAEFLQIQQVNLHAPFRICQAVLSGMQSAGWGRIVNIASIWSIVSKEQRAPYSASKFGIDGMTVALAAEVAQQGVLVNCVSPGFIDTELTREVLGETGINEMVQKVPIMRLGDCQEVARLVLWLCSEENTYVTAQNIAIDGGFSRV